MCVSLHSQESYFPPFRLSDNFDVLRHMYLSSDSVAYADKNIGYFEIVNDCSPIFIVDTYITLLIPFLSFHVQQQITSQPKHLSDCMLC